MSRTLAECIDSYICSNTPLLMALANACGRSAIANIRGESPPGRVLIEATDGPVILAMPAPGERRPRRRSRNHRAM